jgi:hypothetical protein
MDENADNDIGETYRSILANSDELGAERKSSRVNFCWTEEAEKILINVAVKHEAYHKTKGTSMDTKWNLVRAELLTDHDRFKNWPEMKWETLKAKFNRMLSDVDAKFAISSEGANLSGLPEESMSDRDKMLVGILECLAEETADRAALKAKDRKRQVIKM